MKSGSLGVTLGHVGRIDAQRPRQLGGSTKEFLVPPVTPSTNRLGQRNCWRSAIECDSDGQTATTNGPDPEERAQQQAARNAKAALPNLGDVGEMIRELRPVGGHVIEPSADDATDDSPHRNCIGVVFAADATLLETTTHQPHPGHNAERDH